MKLTKGQQKSTGETFPTKTGSTLTIVGVGECLDKRGRWDGKFILHCSTCSLDTELWPYGSISSPKGSIKKGSFPCDCATGNPRYTDEQDIIATNRELANINPDLKIVGIDNNCSYKRYVLTCEVCSKDKELWPDGSITSVKGSLRQGMKPCGCVPNREYTEHQDKIRVQRILDETLPNLKVRYRDKVEGKSTYFIMECDKCSQDSELWPLGSIKSVVGSLKVGTIPCGCSNSPQWTEDQYKVRVYRKAESLGIKVLKLWGGFEGTDSEVTVSYKDESKKVKIKYLLYYKNRGTIFNPRIGISLKMRTPIQEVMRIAQEKDLPFRTLSYIHDKGKVMEYTCNICSSDEYVLNGVCSGKFKTSLNQVNNGNRACRCSPTYRWNKSQQEFKIKALMEEGEEFLHWSNLKDDGEITSKSLIHWECKEGHKVVTNQSNFIDKGSRCRKCLFNFKKKQGHGYGYYPDRAKDGDNLYVIAFHKDETIKVGRAFDVLSRLKGTSTCLLKKSNHSMDEVAILKIMKGTHQAVYDTEQWMHQELTLRGFHADWIGWTTECFTEESKDMIELLLKDCDLTEKGEVCQI